MFSENYLNGYFINYIVLSFTRIVVWLIFYKIKSIILQML